MPIKYPIVARLTFISYDEASSDRSKITISFSTIDFCTDKNDMIMKICIVQHAQFYSQLTCPCKQSFCFYLLHYFYSPHMTVLHSSRNDWVAHTNADEWYSLYNSKSWVKKIQNASE